MPDFTINTFRQLLTTLQGQNYKFQTFAGFLKNPAFRSIILRHDVDARKMNSLQTARLENELGINGTYYFRMVPQSFDEKIIKEIAGLGQEIGYHYEDLSRCAKRYKRLHNNANAQNLLNLHDLQDLHDLHDKVLPDEKLLEMAIISFRENLAKLRRVVPVETICMHGSPLSRYDNRLLWEKYDYRDFGIIGEPYFDVNFDEVLYLTDTGRRWDGASVSIRDKAVGSWQLAKGRKEESRGEVNAQSLELRAQGEEKRGDEKQTATSTPQPATAFKFHSTFDIIHAAKNDLLPNQIMITVHPQRWENRPIPWIWEFVWQNVKNIVKRLVKSPRTNYA